MELIDRALDAVEAGGLDAIAGAAPGRRSGTT
jgi:hypothetical protein